MAVWIATFNQSARNWKDQAVYIAPHLSVRKAYVLGGLMAFLHRFHVPILYFICRYAHILRMVLPPLPPPGRRKGTIRVLHTTCSFDLGGTQRQILHLCSRNDSPAVRHEAVEVFPEHNFLFRRGVKVDRERYIRGNPLWRMLGNLLVYASTRSYQLIQIYKFVRDIRAARPDVVVGWGHEIAMLTFVAGTIARVPKIVFCIRTFNPSYEWVTPEMGRLLRKAHQRMIPRVDRVITNSTALRRDYTAWLNNALCNVSVCPNGIDVETPDEVEAAEFRARIRRELRIPPEAVVISNVGRFSKEKGQMVLVKAFERVVAGRRPPVHLMLIGDGPTKPGIEKYVKERNIPNVLFCGRIENVKPHFCASDVFVMPSDFEGMPNAMMEAMAFGLPCISTNVSGALDVARDGMEALYTEVGSVDRMAEKLAFMLDRPEERTAIGKRAKARIDDFSVPRMIKTYNGYLCDVMRNVNGVSKNREEEKHAAV